MPGPVAVGPEKEQLVEGKFLLQGSFQLQGALLDEGRLDACEHLGEGTCPAPVETPGNVDAHGDDADEHCHTERLSMAAHPSTSDWGPGPGTLPSVTAAARMAPTHAAS